MRKIAVEEHYTDSELSPSMDGRWPKEISRRLGSLGELRLAEMDEAGIDMQILSHSEPAVQNLEPDEAVPAAARLNDRLHETVKENPRRFAAFAALPTSNPEAAADELQRSVEDLGFVSALISGLTRGEFLDLPKFRPIFTRAASLDVPIYIHPGTPHPDVIKAYYADYTDKYPGVIHAPLGFTVETYTQAVRLVLSGVFQELPSLKIVLGHLGEGIPFLLRRIDRTLYDAHGTSVNFREIFNRHFHVTTSGFFSDAALECTIAELGSEKVLFAVDWPWGNNGMAVKWLDSTLISDEARSDIYAGNAERLFKLSRNPK